MSFLAKGKKGRAKPGEDKEFKKLHPAIWEYLTTETFEGKPRQTSTLLVLWENGVKVMLNDRQEGLTLWSGGSTVAEALLNLEAELEGPDPDWRQSNWKKGKRG